MKPNHHSLTYKRQLNPYKTYKDLTQKQKARISEWMYQSTKVFYEKNQRMPNVQDCDLICSAVYQKIESAAIWIPYEEIYKQLRNRQMKFKARILRESESVLSNKQENSLDSCGEKPKLIKQKRKRCKRKAKSKLPFPKGEDFQNDDFFYIAGYTSGGAPYGVTWNEMGLNPWQSTDDINLDD